MKNWFSHSFKYQLKSYSCGPAATSALPASFPSYLAKFLTNLCARSFAFSSHSEASAYVSRGSRIPVSTPSSSVGTSKLKVWDCLCRSVVDCSVQDCIDDTTCIFDGDTFSCSIPSCIYEVSFSSTLLHLLNKLFCIFCWVQFEECLSEAS